MLLRYVVLFFFLINFHYPLYSLTQTKAEQDKMLSIQYTLKEKEFSLIESSVMGYLFLKLNITFAVEISEATNRLTSLIESKTKTQNFIYSMNSLKLNLQDFDTNYKKIIAIFNGLFQELNSKNYKEEALDKIMNDYIAALFTLEYKDIIKKIFLPLKDGINIYVFRNALMRSIQETQEDIWSAKSKIDLLVPILGKSRESIQEYFKLQQQELDEIRNSYYVILKLRRTEEKEQEQEQEKEEQE